MPYMTETSRNCTRCSKELTDAASMEAGIGPICRKLDNALLAKLIPSNLTRAREVLATLDLTTAAPETMTVLVSIETSIMADDAHTRDDWRLEVKRIEWALSFHGNNSFRKGLTSVVAALGYVGLASLWNGEAATGKAAVTCLNDRLVVQGPKNSAARATFKRISGFKFHPASNGSKPQWSFPVAEHAAVLLAVITHYPNNEGLDLAIEGAKTYIANLPPPPAPTPAAVVPAAVAAPALPKAKCAVESVGVLLKVRTPYKPEFINDLKNELPWTDRRWNSGEKVWEVSANHSSFVLGLVIKHYGNDALVPA